MAKNLEIQAHKEWLGFLQPVGLVVSPTALVAAQASVNRNVVELQQQLLANVSETSHSLRISDFRTFSIDILGWEITDLIDTPEILEELAVEEEQKFTQGKIVVKAARKAGIAPKQYLEQLSNYTLVMLTPICIWQEDEDGNFKYSLASGLNAVKS